MVISLCIHILQIGMCRIAGKSNLPDIRCVTIRPDTGYSTWPKLIFGCFLSAAPRYRFARLASHETIA